MRRQAATQVWPHSSQSSLSLLLTWRTFSRTRSVLSSSRSLSLPHALSFFSLSHTHKLQVAQATTRCGCYTSYLAALASGAEPKPKFGFLLAGSSSSDPAVLQASLYYTWRLHKIRSALMALGAAPDEGTQPPPQQQQQQVIRRGG